MNKKYTSTQKDSKCCLFHFLTINHSETVSYETQNLDLGPV